MTILCLASYEKGQEFLRECKRQGAHVVLLTSESLKDKADWPQEAIDEIFYMPDVDNKWDRTHTLHAVAYLARTRQIERLVPLDDFDLEMAAFLREHLRIPGMGETTTRYFRDKLASRSKAQDAGIRVPQFVHILNHDRIRKFLTEVPGPWVLKPRMMAGAVGIRKVATAEELWPLLEALGDQQSYYLLEQFIPGDVFHVDSIVYEREIRFAIASAYGRPPLAVSHEGGVFTTRILHREEATSRELIEMNICVLNGLGLLRGVSHTEFIRAHTGEIYFLETAARVGGAHIADLVEAATGVNLWAEWAKIEIAGGKSPYSVAPSRDQYAGLIVSLARQEWPDTSAFNEPEVVWRMKKSHHIGLIVASPDYGRVAELMDRYAARIQQEFWAYAPPQDKALH